MRRCEASSLGGCLGGWQPWPPSRATMATRRYHCWKRPIRKAGRRANPRSWLSRSWTDFRQVAAEVVDGDTIVPASARRPFLLVPLTLLAGACLVSLAVVAFWLFAGASRGLSNATEASARIGPVAALAFSYIRWIYVARTRLTISEGIIAFDQPLSSWSIARNQVVDVELSGALTPTHRGGIGAGVRLVLADGRGRFIPDVLALPRMELAALIAPSARR